MSVAWVPERRFERRLGGWAAALLLGVAPLTLFVSSLYPARQPEASAAMVELRLVSERPRPPSQRPVATVPQILRGQASGRPASSDAPVLIHEEVRSAERVGLIESASSQTPDGAASAPALDLKVNAATVKNLRGAGNLTREDLVRLGVTDPRSQLERSITGSAVPECMSGDALKHGPDLGPFVGVNGIARLPLWLTAIATGKCKVP